MEAKDTVMNNDETLDKFGVALNENILNRDERLRVVVEAQAEISLKAGRKEVVEWLAANCACFQPDPEKNGEYIIPEWQAKLKEWGVTLDK